MSRSGAVPFLAGIAAAAACYLAFGRRRGAATKELKYWNGRGLMDTARFMLIIADKSFTDTRVGDAAPHTPYSEIGDLDTNLGRMPVIITDQGPVGQSAAINFCVATECDMIGRTTYETATILAYCEHIKELKKSYYSLAPWGTEPSTEVLDKFFDSAEPSDKTGPADSSNKARYLKWHLGRLEAMAPDDGYLVGGRISLADVELAVAMANSLTPEQMIDPKTPAFRRENFGSAARTAKALAEHPKLAKIVANVTANERLASWRAGTHPIARPKQGF